MYQQDALDQVCHTNRTLIRLERDEGPALTPPSRGSYRDPARLTVEGADYQCCGGGRRIIRKKIRSND